MIDLICQISTIVCCAFVFSRSEPATDRMNSETAMPIRVAMHFLTTGSAWELGAIVFYAHVPDMATAILSVGIAALLVCERRVRALTGIRMRADQKVGKAT